MKRRILLALPLLLVACGRSSPPPAAPEPRPAAADPAPTAGPVALAEKSAALDWAVSWPAAAAAVPALDAWLRKDAAESKRETGRAAAEEQQASGPDGGFLQHRFAQTWKVEGSTAALISLSGAFFAFTGGAHGMSGWEPLLWERASNAPIPFAALFDDAEAALAKITPGFCRALDAERAERRGAPVVADASDPFTTCPAVVDQVLVPGGPAGQAFTRIRVLVAPYEAGSFAEGEYEIDVPVTADLVALVRPRYRAAFGAAR